MIKSNNANVRVLNFALQIMMRQNPVAKFLISWLACKNFLRLRIYKKHPFAVCYFWHRSKADYHIYGVYDRNISDRL